MKNELISVIVPIYNMEKYLNKCVDSILNQSYSNLEIILIDDGSTDLSTKICDEYEKKDNRIKVYHKKNGGLSDAKNYGIEKANGKYIAFVDSDDWIEKNMYRNMYQKLKETKSNIVICGRYIEYENGKKRKWYNTKEMVMNKEQSLIYLNSFYNFDMSSCDKLYEKVLFEKIKFPYGKKCEDAYTTYLLFDKAEKITYIPECFYHYLQRNGSISRSEKINMDYIYAAEEQLKFFSEKYQHLLYIAETNYVFSVKAIFQISIERKLKLTDEFKLKMKEIKKYYKPILSNRYIGKEKKITYMLFAFFPLLYKLLLKIKYFIRK